MKINIKSSIIWAGRKGGSTWFHPRACVIPQPGGEICLMTMQTISGSDVFGPVHWSVSLDRGESWSQPVEIPKLGRRVLANGLTEGFCDFVPEYHFSTNTVLALGWNVYYHNDILTRPNSKRHPVYTVRTREGEWLPLRILEWHTKNEPTLYTSNCSQRVTNSDGRILIPLSVGYLPEKPRSVCTVLCEFDGKTLTIVKKGNSHANDAGRGLLEPSLALFKSKYYMTIRAEDGYGYVTHSDDGLHWAPIRPWCWENGLPLTMSTTQQRWIANNHGLFLVYTRKSKHNMNVMRWRAPVYMAQVDPQNLCLIQSTERIIFPLIGDGLNQPEYVARMGNFHTTNLSQDESLVTVGETLPSEDWKGNTLLARIEWLI